MSSEDSRSHTPVAIRTRSLVVFGIITVVLIGFLVKATQDASHGSSYYDPCADLPPPPPGQPPPVCAPPPQFFTFFGAWSDSQYFVGAYLPTLLAVLYSALWDVLYLRMREMEPFFQLARREGASAERSLLLAYGPASLPEALYLSVQNHHWAILLAASISLLLAISVPFASEVLRITTSGTCTGTDMGTSCDPQLEFRVPIANFETAVLGITFFVIAVLTIYYAQRPSQTRSEVSSIASIATLLQDPSLVDKIRRVLRAPLKSEQEIVLHEHFYSLAGVQHDSHLQAERLISIQLRPRLDRSSAILYSSIPGNQEKYPGSTQNPTQKASRSPWVMGRIAMSLMALLLLGLLVLILYYRIVGMASGFESFMDSQSIGVRFLMTSLGVLIKFYWVSLEKEIRTREPYRRLSLGKARPEHTILVTSRSHPLTAILCNLLGCHFSLAYLAFVALLSEVLTVALAGVPFNSSQSYTGYLVSTYLSIAIIILMLIALGLAICRRDDNLQLPYPLGSILSTMLYLCNSSMLEDFKDLSSLDTKTRDKRIMSWGKTYKYDRLADHDGGVTFGVDYDESTERVVMVEELQAQTKR